MSDDGLSPQSAAPGQLTATGKYLIIVTAFFGWFFGGSHMAINGLAMRTAALNLLAESKDGELTNDDKKQLAELKTALDGDGDGSIRVSDFPVLARQRIEEMLLADSTRAKAERLQRVIAVAREKEPSVPVSKGELTAVGLTKNPDSKKVSILGAQGNGDGVISDEELRRYVIDARLGKRAGKWFGYYVVAFLFGAALGGLVFGRIGDRFGRAKGLAAAIAWYSVASLASYFVTSTSQLWVLRFVTCMGVGGVWPNGVALMSEAWEGVSRPMLAGVIGTAANVGIFLTFLVGRQVGVEFDNWRWVLLLGGSPVVLAGVVAALVPESPKWLADQQRQARGSDSADPELSADAAVSTWEVFKPGLLGVTLVGILLATVPLLGGWGASNWAQGWADKVGDEVGNPSLKADIGMARSFTGMIGSFLGGMIASVMGRKRSYFAMSVLCLLAAEVSYFFYTPDQIEFLIGFALLGFFSGVFFGWLPLFLPELFVTRVRSTGAGVCFNFGRIITAVTVFAGAILIEAFNEDYALLGKIMSLIYLLGAIGICLMPRGVGGELKD